MDIISLSMTVLLLTPLIIGLYLKQNKKLTADMVCKLILLTGLILRLMYIMYTDITVRQHDVHDFFEHHAGHSEYIWYIYAKHSLPDFDPREIFQFYHPPLHHIICAVWLTIIKAIGLPLKTIGVESLQILTAAYSFLFTVFAYKALKLLDLKSDTLAYCTAIVAFHPTLIILSGSVNNDMLSSLFGMLSLYYTIKWAKDKKWLSIIMIALSVGLGMFTKLSVGLLAPAIAAVFLYVLIKSKGEYKKLIPQFLVFGIICVPIGLFWSVRNYVRFDVPFGYVPKLSENSGQFIDKTPLERLTTWSLYQFSSPFTQWTWNGADYDEFNPIIALLKNAMFDEQTFFRRSITLQSFCTVLFFFGIVTAVFSVAALFVMWIKNKDIGFEFKLLLTVTAAVIFGNYLKFCMDYSQVCTENMRYCVPLIFVGAAVIGFFIDKGYDSKNKYYKCSVAVLKRSMVMFCGFSVFVYTAMMFYTRAYL